MSLPTGARWLGGLLGAAGPLGQQVQVGEAGGHAAGRRLAALLPRAVDGGGGERLAAHTLAGHLRADTKGRV